MSAYVNAYVNALSCHCFTSSSGDSFTHGSFSMFRLSSAIDFGLGSLHDRDHGNQIMLNVL